MPDKILLLLRAEPAEGFEWSEPAAPAEASQRPVVYRRTQAGDLHIVMLGAKSGATPVFDLGPISWRYAAPAKAADHVLHVTIEEPRVLARNGQPLDVALTNVEIDLNTEEAVGR